MASKNDDYLSFIAKMNHDEILPDVPKVLNYLKEQDQPISLGSASKNARQILEKVDLLKQFDAIVDGNDVSKAKPDPEVFLIAAKAKGISYFKNLAELNEKESPRLQWGSRILSEMGVKNITTKDSIKIYGNPKLKINKKIIIKNFLKDHRIFMTCVIAALTFGGKWEIFDRSSVKTSFPSFLSKIQELGLKL